LLVVLPVLLSLGRWQLGRAAEKEALLAEYAEARESRAVNLVDVGDDWAALQYHDVLLSGDWQPERQLLLDNRVYQHRVGFEVLTPLQLSDGRTVLVNRGWVPQGERREDLPDLRMAATDSSSLRGVFVQPLRAFSLGAAASGHAGEWPAVVQFYDFAVLSRLVGRELIPGVVHLSANQAALYTHVWKPLPEGPEKHYSYALQWFAMAGAVLILYITLNTRRADREEETA
jgi:cytochrome oxidase assembly protein ShyY1